MSSHNRTSGRLLQVTAAIALASGLSACSVVPEWADPTSWFGDDKPATADASGQTPDLAAIPDKPDAAAGTRAVADSLTADRNNVQYSGETLRAGSESAAPPPPDLPSAPVAAVAEVKAPEAPAATTPTPDAPVQTAQTDTSLLRDPDPASTSMPGTLPHVGVPVRTAEIPAGTQPALPPQAQPEPVRAAGVAAPRVVEGPLVASEPSAQPSRKKKVTPQPDETQVAAVDPSDAALGFKPSAAPPLDPSIGEFVPAAIVQHYKATAPGGVKPVAPPTRVASAKPGRAEGGPDTMEGEVVANLGVIENATPEPAYNPAMGMTPTAVVYFPGDRTSLDTEARAAVADVAAQFKSRGGTGFVKVVGHASSRTANMPVDRHLALIFKKSQDRANAVAQALIRAGVPASNILVEAVGDSQPIYYESMPKGEDGNRRAEIFLQG